MRNFAIILAALAIFGLSGCQKTAKSDSLLATSSDDLVGRWHFTGTAQISADAKAAEINSFGRLPATAELRDKMLDQLATAPFRLLSYKFVNQNSNVYAPLIRPLLEDLLRTESYAELRGHTNPVPELMLAVRLDNARAKLWQTNLATVISAWTGIPVNPLRGDGFDGWELKKHHDPNVIRCLRSGDWILFGWGWNEMPLQPEFLQRIKENKLGADCSKTAFLDVLLNWPDVMAARANDFPFPLPAKLPKMHLLVEGQKEFVRSTLSMQFPQPLGVNLEPWQIPTAIIPMPFSSFTTARGIASWLGQYPKIKQASPDFTPNQLTMWSVEGVPFDTAIAIPVTNASNYLAKIEPGLIGVINEQLAKGYNGIKATWNGREIASQGSPLVNFHIKPLHEPAGDYLIGSFFPTVMLTNKNNFPPNLIREIKSKPNLVYYGWEMGQDRAFQWEAIHQVELLMSGKTFPGTNAPVEKWLLTARPRLGTCATEISLTAPNELTLIRNSTLGFSGLEMASLEFWMDSTNFPFHASYPVPTVPPPGIRKPAKAK